MKFRIQRNKEKKREKLIRKIVSELNKLNPENSFFTNGRTIRVDTCKLMNLRFPDMVIVLSQDEENGFVTIKVDDFYTDL